MNPHTKEYIAYMQSEAWNEKRLERLQMDGYTCQDCGANDKPLDVHHLTYERFKREYMSDLVSLCRRCHDYRHGKITISSFTCPVCLQFLPIAIQKIRLMKHDVMKLVCADGHVRTYNDDDDRAYNIKRYLL